MYNLDNKKIDEITILQINKEYQIYFLFVTFLISLQLICNVIEPLVFHFWTFKIPASAIFYVLSFTINDILAENYGLKLAIRANVLNIISQFIYCGIAALTFLMSKHYQMLSGSESLNYFFHFLSLELISSILSLLASMITNDYLISWLKFIFLSKGFWWRTIISTILGEIVMLNIDYNLTFFGNKSLIDVQSLIASSMCYKVIAAFLLALPATIISNYLGNKVHFLKPRINIKTNLLKELKYAFTFK